MLGTSTTETFDAFFSDFYLRAYADEAREAEAEAQALAAARLAGCEPGAEIVDVPCGFGRHSIALARAGYRVTGVDRSQVLLDEARRRAGGERWPKLTRADYRDLPFAEGSFDAALNLFTSLGYLGDEEDVKALAAIRRVLRPGGRLVVEMMHRDRMLLDWSDNDWRLMGEGRLLLEQRTFDPVTGVAQSTQTLIDGDGKRESRTFGVRVYTATELLTMIDRAGYADARAYGSLEGEPFTTSSRLAVVATS